MIVNKNKNKEKPVIEDIVISQEKLAEFNSELKSSSAWNKYKHGIIRKYFGGTCTYCSGIPTKKLKYDLGDGKLVEWYCAKCFKRWVEN